MVTIQTDGQDLTIILSISKVLDWQT